MQTIQQRTNGLVLDRLTANRTGQIITLAAIGGAGLGRGVARAQDATPVDFEAPVDVINYALTLEHIENAFYMGVADFAGPTSRRSAFSPASRTAWPRSASTRPPTSMP